MYIFYCVNEKIIKTLEEEKTNAMEMAKKKIEKRKEKKKTP